MMAHAGEAKTEPSWAMSETTEEALRALQLYKKKDAEKGT